MTHTPLLQVHTPRRIEALSAVRVLHAAAGGGHSLAVTAGSAVYSWGANQSGQLGHGDTSLRHLPSRIACLPLDSTALPRVEAGHACSLLIGSPSAGAFYYCGALGSKKDGKDGFSMERQLWTECLMGTEPGQVQAGMAHILVAERSSCCSLPTTSNASPPRPPQRPCIFSMGCADVGQLGLGDYVTQPRPVQVPDVFFE
jgi:hypothetical protein